MKKSGEGGGKAEKAGELAAGAKALEKEAPKDFAEVRSNLAEEVRLASNEILSALIAGAKGGQVAAVKYLFEAVGVYPANEETMEKPEESIVYSLYKQIVEAHPHTVDAGEAGAETAKTVEAVAEGARSEIAGGGCENDIQAMCDGDSRREDAVE